MVNSINGTACGSEKKQAIGRRERRPADNNVNYQGVTVTEECKNTCYSRSRYILSEVPGGLHCQECGGGPN